MILAIGCPVHQRAWILPSWRDHIIASCEKADVKSKFYFITSTDDKPTTDIVKSFPETKYIHAVQEPKVDGRNWNIHRYQHMVELRNTLLNAVRHHHPDYFLSLDSDILVHEDLVSNLLETAEEKQADAVGGKAYMDYGTQTASYGVWQNHDKTIYARGDQLGVFPADILMAIKLMGPKAYQTDYKVATHGEDFGWSENLKQSGGVLYFDGRVANKHIMHEERLHEFDKRCGY